jgi:mRNA interferase MazF
MAHFIFGEVVWVEFPFSDYTGAKVRPAVIVSSPKYNRERPEVLLMPLTSQLRHGDSFGSVALDDWQVAGLSRPSVFKPLIAPCLNTRVRNRIGRLSKRDKQALRNLLSLIFASDI